MPLLLLYVCFFVVQLFFNFEKGKFETWLGSIIKPQKKFYLVSEDKEQLQRMFERTAAIGYESQVAEGFVIDSGIVKQEKINVD